MPEEQLQPREGEAGEGSEDGERMSGRAETGVGVSSGTTSERDSEQRRAQGGLPPAFRMRTEAQAKWARSASLVVGDVKHYSK